MRVYIIRIVYGTSITVPGTTNHRRDAGQGRAQGHRDAKDASYLLRRLPDGTRKKGEKEKT